MADVRTWQGQPTTPPLPEPVPDWRATLRTAGRCWFGGLVLALGLIPLVQPRDSYVVVGAILALMLVTGVVSTLGTLVIESLTAQRQSIGAHIAVIGFAGLIVIGVLSLQATWAIAGALACAGAAAVGALIAIGRPTWRRYVVILAIALVISLLAPLLLDT